MKYFKILIMCFMVFIGGCGMSNKIIQEQKPFYRTDRNFNASFDDVWNATLRTISYFPLTIIEKNSGIINTDWLNYKDTLKVSVWRGLIGGGQVDDEMPVDKMHRFNVLATQKDSSLVNVRIIRYVKVRPYRQTAGGTGNWEPDVSATYEQIQSDTQQENKILNEIDKMLQAKK